MADPLLRATITDGGAPVGEITVNPASKPSPDSFPAKAWCLDADVMNLSDSAVFTIANDRGQVTGKFRPGQRVELDESDPEVAGGAFTRCFTGRIT